MTAGFTESAVEDATLAWLTSLGYAVLRGPDIAAGEPAAEALGCGLGGLPWPEVERRMRDAFEQLPKVHWLVYEPAVRLTRQEFENLLCLQLYSQNP